MVNHVRTLLMNINGGDTDPLTPGEQVVPLAYRSIRLPAWMATIRGALFGSRPDRVMLNYRMAQLLPVLHATELSGYVTALDRRITYQRDVTELFDPRTFLPSVVADDATSGELMLTGTPVPPDVTGTCSYRWVLTLAGSSLTLQPEQPAGTDSEIALSFSNGLSQSVSLGRSGYAVRVPQLVSGQWRVSYCNRPEWDLSDLMLVIQDLGAPLMLSLFGASRSEPYTTFYNCFTKHEQLPYRLGGFLLAMAYRTEESRTAGSVTTSTITGPVPVAAMDG